jgi:hypothetical protein
VNHWRATSTVSWWCHLLGVAGIVGEAGVQCESCLTHGGLGL